MSLPGNFTSTDVDRAFCDHYARSAKKLQYKPYECNLYSFDGTNFHSKCMNNRRLIFIGDSLNNQHFSTIIGHFNKADIKKCKTSVFTSLQPIVVESLIASYRRDFYVCINIGSMEIHKMIMPTFNKTKANEIILKDNDVVFGCFAMHYHQIGELIHGMSEFFKWIEKQKVSIINVIREASPTHFPSSDGTYELYMSKEYSNYRTNCMTSKSCGCTSKVIRNIDHQLWRNLAIDQLIRESKMKSEVHLFRVFNMLRREWRGHKASLTIDGRCCSNAFNISTNFSCSTPKMDCLHWNDYVMEAINKVFYNQLCFDILHKV